MLRNDYPRPQFVRDSWLNLNGEWEFEYDDGNAGERERWYEGRTLDRRIEVPFCYQSKLSGIGETACHDIVWYRRSVTLPSAFDGKRALLHFGAVDYEAKVWVNGRLAVTHEGGHTPFHADVTDLLQPGANVIVVRAQDYSKDLTLPRGKQYWKEKSAGIFYTPTTGIWQTVWMEPVSDIRLDKLRLTPDIDSNSIGLQAFHAGAIGGNDVRLTVKISYQGEAVTEDEIRIQEAEAHRLIHLNDRKRDVGARRLWTPAAPNLYDAELTLQVNGQTVDRVQTYFGMRKISVADGKICLNNRPYRMKMVLDQGYFPDGILTPPSDEAIRRDVELTKEMGFNGARKHQKIEDPRYMYWCDKLGLLVWGEMANAYHYSPAYVKRVTKEWQEAVERDYNHPCIVAWVPLNESWGAPDILNDKQQQQHALSLYYLTKSLDPMRPVISNDGWEHVKSDICTIHDYAWSKEVLEERYSTAEKAVSALPANTWIYAAGYSYDGEPIHLSEFGGISFRKSDWEGWGYSSAKDDKDFVERLAAVVHPILASPVVQGYCYTQLTDVEQEINGLLTYDRQPKIPLEWIKAINEGKTPVIESLDETDAGK